MELEHQARYRAFQAKAAQRRAAKEAEAAEAAAGPKFEAAARAPDDIANDNAAQMPDAADKQEAGSGLLTYTQVIGQAGVKLEQVLGPFLRPGQVSMLYGQPGAGKSFLALQSAVCVASGKPLAHEKPPQAAPVLFLSAEDSGPVLASRLMGAAAGVGAPADLLDQNLRIVDVSNQVLMFTKMADGQRTITPEGMNIFRQAKLLGTKLIVLDPLVEIHNLVEADNGDMGYVMGILRGAARKLGCAILVVHHLAKGDEQTVGVNSGRGASSLGAAARAVRVVAALTKEELAKLGVESSEAADFFKVIDVKASYSRRRHTPTYFKREIGRANGFPSVKITHITGEEVKARATAA